MVEINQPLPVTPEACEAGLDIGGPQRQSALLIGMTGYPPFKRTDVHRGYDDVEAVRV